MIMINENWEQVKDLSDTETKNARICIYRDPINSGGNDYADGFVDITYSICPKGLSVK